MKVALLGFGEVGQALASIEKEAGHQVLIKDLERNELQPSPVLHICIPFNDGFFASCRRAISESQPEIIIVHATVPVGTTRKVGQENQVEAVHSPIRGMHPNLVPGIKTFPKFIGPVTAQASVKAQTHLEKMGLTTVICQDPETTEFAKLYDTLYYAWNIVFCKEVAALCQKQGVNFGQAYTLWNRSYNEGYQKLGKDSVTRPVLTPQDGPIGGHCLIPNAQLAAEQFGDSLSRFVLEANSHY